MNSGTDKPVDPGSTSFQAYAEDVSKRYGAHTHRGAVAHEALRSRDRLAMLDKIVEALARAGYHADDVGGPDAAECIREMADERRRLRDALACIETRATQQQAVEIRDMAYTALVAVNGGVVARGASPWRKQ